MTAVVSKGGAILLTMANFCLNTVGIVPSVQELRFHRVEIFGSVVTYKM